MRNDRVDSELHAYKHEMIIILMVPSLNGQVI